MLKSRAKIRKTQDKPCFTQASIADSDCQKTQSGALIGSNDDLLTEIFLRLPVISIVRFKSVSKHWRSLLSDRRFTLLYDKVPVSSGLFVCNLYIPFDVGSENAPPFRSLEFYHDRRCIKIVQSCNGLLLCCSNRHTYYVVNPTTMQLAVIPLIIGGEVASKTIHFMSLAFHQTDCVHFKLVCFRKVKPKGGLFQIQIYSSETGNWRVSNESFYLSGSIGFKYGAYWNGAIHWIPSIYDLLYFKLEVEHVQKLSLPDPVASEDGERLLHFGESGDHLHLVSAPQESNLQLNVYEMLSDHSGWFIKYKLDLYELAVAYPDMDRADQYYYKFELFDVIRAEEEEDTFMVVRISGKIVRYNILNKSFKEIFLLPNALRLDTVADVAVYRYTQTIASL